MELTIEEIDEIDEITNNILTTITQTTQWKEKTRSILEADNYHSMIVPTIQQIDAKLQAKISDILRKLYLKEDKK